MRLTGRAGAIAPELKGEVTGFKVFLAAAAIAGVASAAQGAIVDLRVEDRAGSLPGFQTFGPNVYLADQVAFRGEADNRDCLAQG